MYEELYVQGKTAGEAVERLIQIIELLRSEKGCPWDQAQTHDTLKACLVEETYEVIEAIEKHDWDNLEEELGDVLLQIIFHGSLRQAEGDFDLKSIANRVCNKMISRHPHVFSNNRAETIDTVLEKWENMKRKEKRGTRAEAMQKIPKSLPALRKSYKVQAKAAEVGFDWDLVEQAFEKVVEETGELGEIINTNSHERIQEELGDLLFAVVNVARLLRVDPEDALNFASQKFIRRFSFIEETAGSKGQKLEEMTLTEMDKLWDEAKSKEKLFINQCEVKE
ncbi:MAG: nucleoside triphosphate pyrophosphohydrolase [Anaerovoracaceae bacterium]|jgi:tetrapyrrole methylase family protein/MazG family protein